MKTRKTKYKQQGNCNGNGDGNSILFMNIQRISKSNGILY